MANIQRAHAHGETNAAASSELVIPLELSRAAELREEVKFGWVHVELAVGLATAAPIVLSSDKSEATFRIRLANDPQLAGEQMFKIRATALKDGRWPVISETTVPVVVK